MMSGSIGDASIGYLMIGDDGSDREIGVAAIGQLVIS